ncbi:MAG: hypothetical protein HDQ96_07450 [Lachnospiraceae bacterium]|nr:hypothetical protein [Lachnospiraceae bacterium]
MDYFDWYAAYLHRTFPVVDGHRDLVTDIYRRRLKGERGILNQYYKKEFVKSGVNLIFASLFLGADELEDCKENGTFSGGTLLKKGMEMLAAFYTDLEETKGKVQLVTDKESLLRITPKRCLPIHHRVGILLYLEGLDVLDGDPELLRCFWMMGVRGAALTWNDRRNGMEAITEKGVQALFLMEKLGIFVDSSHLSREAAWLLPSFTKRPFAATHSNAAALLDDERNLTDEEIKEIAGREGVIGVNAYHDFVQDNKSQKPEIEALCDHIVYLMKTAGEDHVGFGLDLGEGTILTGYGELKRVTACLLRRGMSIEAVKKVLGRNWIRYLLQILK